MTLFIATPCYRSDPHLALGWAYQMVKALALEGEGATASAPISPFLTTSQAQLVAKFLDGKCSHFFFREDDVYFKPEVLGRMLAKKVPAIVAPYRVRGTERFETMFDDAGDVLWAGLGCALLERRVLETLWRDHYAELHYKQDGKELVDLTAEFFAERDDGRQKLKGDHAFWYRVRQAGYRIVALEDVIVDHAGEISHFRPR